MAENPFTYTIDSEIGTQVNPAGMAEGIAGPADATGGESTYKGGSLGGEQGIHSVKTRPNGSGYVMWGNGAVATFSNSSEMSSVLAKIGSNLGVNPNDMGEFLRGQGVEFIVGTNDDGSLYVDAGSKDNPPKGTNAPGNATRSPGASASGGVAGGPATSSGSTGGASGGSGGAGGGGGGGGISGSTGGGGGGGGDSSFPYGGGPPIGGDPGAAGVDPNRNLGVNDPGKQDMSLGDYFQNSRGGLGGGNSIFDLLPENPTIKDVLGAVQRSQEGTRDAQLDIFSGLFDESLTGEASKARRDLAMNVIQNPESMDEATVSRIMGQNNQAIGNRASQLGQLAQDRAASMGVGRDVGQREQSRILREGAAQQTEAERATRIDAAKTNFQDRLNALQGGGGAVQQDFQNRANIGGAAASVLGSSQDRGDTFLTNALLTAPETPKIAGQNQVRYNYTTPRFYG